ncbi:MAG: protein-methionine-sulfoxide reductase heme-binding subunit MsrQ [Rhodobacteraceae bacterium]|nr:protein-methionine-sulfoxide reductase heme-binding subunit MsrQ [Paracoccaceae bacterium]
MIGTANRGLRAIPVWIAYLLLLLPAPVLFYMGLTGGLGVEPIEALEHEYGELALKLVVLGLAVTPLRRWTGLNLMKFRRTIGVVTFVYVVLHLLVWMVLDMQTLDAIWADILKRPYITVGMTAFVLLVPLAVTSNNISVRKLGPRWRVLHRLVYPAAILGALHYILLARGFQIEPLVYMGVILVLLALRLNFGRFRDLVRQ